LFGRAVKHLIESMPGNISLPSGVLSNPARGITTIQFDLIGNDSMVSDFDR
jgi:hypothetical protein